MTEFWKNSSVIIIKLPTSLSNGACSVTSPVLRSTENKSVKDVEYQTRSPSASVARNVPTTVPEIKTVHRKIEINFL